jgi:hypothetical protein
MGDPYSMGMASKYAKGPPTSPTVTFGKANYTATSQSSSAGGSTTTPNSTNYGTQPGVVRNPQYVTVLSGDLAPVAHKSAAIQADVREVISRSARLPSKNSVQVNVQGDVVILSGSVGTYHERLIVEGIAKMTPGVREVQNQLQVK